MASQREEDSTRRSCFDRQQKVDGRRDSVGHNTKCKFSTNCRERQLPNIDRGKLMVAEYGGVRRTFSPSTTEVDVLRARAQVDNNNDDDQQQQQFTSLDAACRDIHKGRAGPGRPTYNRVFLRIATITATSRRRRDARTCYSRRERGQIHPRTDTR